MQGRGFIFSLDAFVAFTLVMITISLLIFLIGTPQPFYPSFEQAHTLAYDTLSVLSTSSDLSIGERTYLEQIIWEGPGQPTSRIMRKVAGGNGSYSPIIPRGYGFRLEKLVFQSDGSAVVASPPLYDSATDPESDRYGKTFTKLQSSSSTFLSLYSSPRVLGESPYCYLNCNGYGRAPGSLCDRTPCNVSKDQSDPGLHDIVIVQLVVYT